MKGYIHSTESMGTVDGPGIRFVVFMQGCPLRCQYCHNPDTWELKNASKEISVKEILQKYERYRPYLKNGGITVSGGEPLMQMEFVINLFEEAKKAKIHTCLDTSGITFNRNDKNKLEQFIYLTKVTDLVMLDIKHIDSKKHYEIVGVPNEDILDFAKFLDEMNIAVWIRHVVVPGLTDDRQSLEKLGEFIGRRKNVQAIDLLPYHTMGKSKYKRMGINYSLEKLLPLSDEEVGKAREILLCGVKNTKI